MTRSEAARELCRRLTADVHAVAPPGLGRWGRAWQLVAGATDAFLDELHAWEHDGSRHRVEHIQHLYDEVVAAWAMAASEYLAARNGVMHAPTGTPWTNAYPMDGGCT